MVGRILTYLKGRNLLREPGDLVEVDTLNIRPLPGVVLKQFTARDVVSRWGCVRGAYQSHRYYSHQLPWSNSRTNAFRG